MCERDHLELESDTRDTGAPGADDINGDRDGDVRIDPAERNNFAHGELGYGTLVESGLATVFRRRWMMTFWKWKRRATSGRNSEMRLLVGA